MSSILKDRVDIIMATFNGAHYIEQQILSLIAQTFKNWTLYIHDDGSSDNTLAIAERYSNFDNRINIIHDGVVCGGAAQNFLHLLKNTTAPFVIFCDQDDIWFESKLERLYSFIKNEDKPCAVYCNAYSYDGTNITSAKVTQFHRSGLKDSLFLNSGVQGCSLMFNRALIDCIIVVPKYVHMHDHLLTIAAVTFGKLKYIDESLMFYRQHDSNVTGNVSTSLAKRIKTFLFRSNTVIDNAHFLANVSFYDSYKQLIAEEKKQLFEAYFQYCASSLPIRLKLVLSHGFKIGNYRSILLLKTLLRKPR